MLPGVERGQVEGLYFVPIIYPIGLVVGMIVFGILVMWFSEKYPCELNREQFDVQVGQVRRVEGGDVK